MKKDSFLYNVVTISAAVILALFFRSVAFEPFNIPSGSMIPGLLVGDFLFVEKYAYGYSRYSFPFGSQDILYKDFKGRIWAGTPKRGDVVVFRGPRDPWQNYVKRVMGLPGDKLQVINGVVYINDKAIIQEEVGPYTYKDDDGSMRDAILYKEVLEDGRSHVVIREPEGSLSDNTDPYYVPEGYFFGMGDNRNRSLDSRFLAQFGYIPIENIVGRGFIKFFSVDTSVELTKPWKWPGALRFERFMTWIK